MRWILDQDLQLGNTLKFSTIFHRLSVQFTLLYQIKYSVWRCSFDEVENGKVRHGRIHVKTRHDNVIGRNHTEVTQLAQKAAINMRRIPETSCQLAVKEPGLFSHTS